MNKVTEFLEQTFELERQRPEFCQNFAFMTIPLHKSASKLNQLRNSIETTKKSFNMKLNLNEIKKISIDEAILMNTLFKQYYNKITDKEHADLHGAYIKIVRSSCPQYVGAQGYLIQELPNKIVAFCDGKCVRVFPKKHIDFIVEGCDYVIGAHRSLKYKKLKRFSLWI